MESIRAPVTVFVCQTKVDLQMNERSLSFRAEGVKTLRFLPQRKGQDCGRRRKAPSTARQRSR